MSRMSLSKTKRIIQPPVMKGTLDTARVDEVLRELGTTTFDEMFPDKRDALRIVRNPKVSLEYLGGSERHANSPTGRRSRHAGPTPRARKKK